MKFKHVIALLLCFLLLVSVVPATDVLAAEVSNENAVDAVFKAIDTALSAVTLVRSGLTAEKKTAIAKNLVESLGFQTMDRGDGCFVFEVGGEPCIFNYRMYQIFSEMQPIEGYVDDGEIVTVDYSKRSNGPGGKDIYLIEPFYGLDSQFKVQYQKECASIAQATGGKYTLYKTSAATVDAVAKSLESGGVVVFDSHGDTDYYNLRDSDDFVSKANTSYLLLSTGSGLTAADKSQATGKFGTYYHTMSSSGYYYVDGTAITNHMTKQAPNSLVWMATCLGMATDGLEKPLREHGAGVVYGYSQSVTFDGDYDYEEVFWNNMKNGSDVKTAIAAMKKEVGYWDPGMYCYTLSAAKNNYAAFPIVVSDMDTYPGHGKVDDYQDVKSDWTLFGEPAPSYTLTAVSSNPAFGTVTLDNQVISATPMEGYEVSGYTVSPKDSCEVSQNGNTFVVSNLSQDCTVSVTFTARTKARVTYIVPDGVICQETEAYVGDSISLTTPSGTPTANRYNYRFVGWASAKIEETVIKPSYMASGVSLTLEGDMAFYALYSYTKGSGRTNYYTTELLRICDHQWSEPVTLTAADCTHDGMYQFICTLCGETKTEAASAFGHEYVDGTCTRCGEVDPDYVTPAADACDGYTDIDRTAWYHNAADFVIENGYMGSTGADALAFEPKTECTRSMIVTILYSLAGKPTVTFEEKFPDVKDGQWYTNAVMWAYQNGVVSGYDSGLFGTNDKITREQLAVIFMAYAKKVAEQDTSNHTDLFGFPDANKVTWSKNAVAWAVAEGLISGKGMNGQTLLAPQGRATRAEAAVILMKFLSNS